MKKLATLAMASLAFAVALASCTSAPTLPSVQPIEPLTPQQLVSQACVIVPGVLNILALQADAFPTSAQADIKNAQKIVSGSGPTVPGICTIGATVDATSVQTLANTVMPIIVNAVELSPTVTPQVKAEVAAAQGIFLLIQAQQAAQAGAVAPAIPVVPSTAAAPTK